MQGDFQHSHSKFSQWARTLQASGCVLASEEESSGSSGFRQRKSKAGAASRVGRAGSRRKEGDTPSNTGRGGRRGDHSGKF